MLDDRCKIHLTNTYKIFYLVGRVYTFEGFSHNINFVIVKYSRQKNKTWNVD